MSSPKPPSAQCKKRLEIEEKKMKEDPPQFIKAAPDPSDILIWYYCITGPPETPFEGGQYVGTVTFPPTYPFAPPGIRMLTPSGRFETDVRLCLSISDYHPESWNPIWGLSSILIGLLSFMVGRDDTLGSIKGPKLADQRRLASQSHSFNLSLTKFEQLFPQDAEAAKQRAASSSPSVVPSEIEIKKPTKRQRE